MAGISSGISRSLCLTFVGYLGFLCPCTKSFAKQPLAIDDFYRQESIGEFTVSPRGDEAVYVRTWHDANLPGRRTALWRVDGATGRAAPLEAGEPDGRMPVYSPDGSKLAFITDVKPAAVDIVRERPPVPSYSDRSGYVRVLRRDASAGKSDDRFMTTLLGEQPLTDSFFGRIKFLSDSQTLYYTAGYGFLNRQSARVELRVPAADPFLVVDDQGEGFTGYAAAKVFERTYVLDPFAKVLSHSDPSWCGDPQASPDDSFYVCHANVTSDQESVRYSINKNYDLWQFERKQHGKWLQQPRRVTTNPGPDVSPRISPDGKRVLYLSVPRNGPHMDVFNLCLMPLDQHGVEPRVLINAHDAQRAADGTSPFQPTFPLRDDSWIDDDHVRIRGVRGMQTETIVLNVAGPDAPIAPHAKPEPEPPKNEKLRPPAVNPWLADRHQAREEIVKWPSFDGLEIEGVLTLPPAELAQFKPPYPLIVYPHGGPHSAAKPGFNFAVHLFAAHGYAVFQPNFRGSYGYGRKFLDAARFDMGGSDMRDILTGIDRLIERGVVDRDRQFVYGISYGGYSACRLVTLTRQFRAAVAQNAVTDLHAMWSLSDLQSWTEWEFGGKPWETIEHEGRKIDVGALMRERSPTTDAHLVKTPTLILHADHDRRCPVAMGTMFHRHLKEAGCETEMVVYRDERHALWQTEHQADVLRRVLAWFAKHDDQAAPPIDARGKPRG